MSVDLGATQTVTNLTVALYMLAMSIFPLWWYEVSYFIHSAASFRTNIIQVILL